ncbi:hypothetical protein 13VV501A_gene0082 [Vibrio phage 13VV501A]|nr:hypothetical protein 13VV501A_gene0082 [Vibrio phage 13VV501A]
MSTNTLTTEAFIAKARAVHGDRYDYSKSEYALEHQPVIITCQKHGDFELEPIFHLGGRGCTECASRKRVTKEDFIRRSRMAHGFKYRYHKSQFMTVGHLTTITCPEHGDFQKTASSHMQGVGCPQCKRLPSYMYTEDFVEQARTVHGDKYDYSQTFYVDPYYAMTIICPIHGEFKQRPTGHLNGVGCPDCTPNLDQP